jgi:hypothetical protein
MIEGVRDQALAEPTVWLAPWFSAAWFLQRGTSPLRACSFARVRESAGLSRRAA